MRRIPKAEIRVRIPLRICSKDGFQRWAGLIVRSMPVYRTEFAGVKSHFFTYSVYLKSVNCADFNKSLQWEMTNVGQNQNRRISHLSTAWAKATAIIFPAFSVIPLSHLLLEKRKGEKRKTTRKEETNGPKFSF